MTDAIISIGFDKNGEADFAISGSINGLSLEKMNALRAMVTVAIGTAEGMFRRVQERPTANASQKLETSEGEYPHGPF